jgi:hypothetical protein
MTVTGQQKTRSTYSYSNPVMSSVMWRLYFGKLLNVLGFAALVRECDYRSEAIGANVKVEHRDLFTVISVNGLDVYFSRITGKIDGVGTSQAACCMLDSSPLLADPDGEYVPTPQLARMQRTKD